MASTVPTKKASTKPRPAVFDIATRGGGREPRKGYVLGEWATHKEPGKGVYFWSFTHVPTGVEITVHPTHDSKESALRYLEKLHREGPNEFTKRVIGDGRRWGLGM